MKLGFMCGMAKNGISTIDELVEEVQAAEALGFDQAWMGQVFSSDAVSMMTILGRETTKIRLGTAVTPTFPRHPTALALQALSASAASNGRFDLGVGVSHKLVIENLFGIPYKQTTRHMREYLNVLIPLLRGDSCSFSGDVYQVNAKLNVPEAKAVQVIVAALGPKMLEIAGQLAGGTTTWMTGPKTLETHIIPRINRAAQDAGKPTPRIVVGLPIVLTEDREAVRAKLSKSLAIYSSLPAYRGVLEIEGMEHPVDLAIIGNEKDLLAQLDHLKSIGGTDFNAFCIPTDETAVNRTMTFLAEQRETFD